MGANTLRAILLLAICMVSPGCSKDDVGFYSGARIRVGGDGIMDESIVTNKIMSQMIEVQRCYGARLKKDAALSGQVVVEFTVEASGAVTGVTVAENQTGDTAVARCVTNIVEPMQFRPGPTGGTAIFRYPFEFGKKTL